MTAPSSSSASPSCCSVDPSPSSSSIPLYVSNSKAYIWDAQDLANLRVKHHIAGLNTGTLPGVAQQNAFLGLPTVLMPEEVVLLVQNGECDVA